MKRIIFLLLLISTLSCSKQEIPTVTKTERTKQLSAKKAYYVGPFNFDWEKETYIEYRGSSIKLPWVSGANSGSIPKEISDDFKSIDGWELLYNDFPDGEADPKFILYNKYKGLVKVFLFVTNSTYTASSFTWGFGANTTNCQTSAFNFTKNTAEPAANKYSNPAVYIANYSSDPQAIPNGVNPNYWYCGQFEVMYDPNISNLSHDDIDLRLQCFATNKEFIKLKGNIDGKITGTFSMPSSGGVSGLFSDLVSSFSINNIGKINFPTLSETKTFLTDYATKQTDSYLKSQLTQGLTKLGQSLATTNPWVKVLTNGLLSTSSSAPGRIDCSINAKIAQEGTITSSIAGPSARFKFPGTKNTNLGGILPNYDKPLGVFCITAKPVIKLNENIQYHKNPEEPDGGTYSVDNRLELDLSSFEVIINPEVSASCSQISIEKNIVFEQSMYRSNFHGGTLIDSSGYSDKYLSQGSSIREFYRFFDYSHVSQDQCMVKITITLTPIEKSDPIIIIKEFIPKLKKV